MALKRNSAKCAHCGKEIVSTHVHDFVVHYCKVKPKPGVKWEGDKLVPSGEVTYNFFIDGGNEYRRYGGTFKDMIDTSEYI